jgi:predicted RNA binding protein YcfA (HicA-like mRNA interferase family)
MDNTGWNRGEPDIMKVRDVIKRVEQDGWVLDRTEGSHRQCRHPSKPGQVTIAGHRSEEMHPKTLKSILRQAGLESGR